ncbi:MAG: hypothetical protein HYY20_05195 [Candidatus Tectomicrobia bacterium]|uniref:Uncharacterized protein n=1 Tax=Tectimicrobiota bacterium TaxID=2528274 RepID=A0A932CMR2_UNCTE|nr:hypothetical protein [Candidatus Tectomicrobia bacterium]
MDRERGKEQDPIGPGPRDEGATEPQDEAGELESRRRFLKSGALILGGLLAGSELLQGQGGPKLRYVKPLIETFTGSVSYADEGGRPRNPNKPCNPCGPPSPCRPIEPCPPDLSGSRPDLWS